MMNETNILVPQTEQRFTETVTEILKSADFAQAEPKAGQEFQMERKGHTYCPIIKYSRTRVFPTASAISIYNQLEKLWQTSSWIPLVVVSSEIDASVKAEFLKVNPRTEVVDIRNLLYLAAKNRGLYDELAGLLPYSVSSLKLQPPAFLQKPGHSTTGGNSSNSRTDSAGYIRTEPPYSSGTAKRRGADASSSFRGMTDQDNSNHDAEKTDTLRQQAHMQEAPDYSELRRELAQWQGGKVNPSSEYEKLCTKVLNRLFSLDDLTLWVTQAKSNDELYRFDLICKIKQDNHKDFWEMAERHFHSKYIIFEFKNYSGQVTQMEVTTTARYLYTKALRTVAIIVSPHGFSDHAEKAARGALREEGKLILSLTNADLLKMLQQKEAGNDPSAYLSEKLDTLLINLEK